MQRKNTIRDESEFPRRAAVVDQLNFILQYAVLAPSIRNSQPWQFMLQDDAIELYADISRALPVVDPDHRELVISCGAALEHLAVAVRHFGFAPVIAHFPDPENPLMLARIRFGCAAPEDADNALVFYSLHRRRTDRRPFSTRKINGEMLANLILSAATSDVWVDMIDGPKRRGAIAGLIAEADLVQGRDPKFREELSRWLSPPGSGRLDGIPAEARGLSYVGAMLEYMLVKRTDLGPRRAAADRRMAEEAPLLVVMGTDGDEPGAWMQTGRSLARLLLHARAAGLSASFFSQALQVPALRRKLAGLCGDKGDPQVLLRLGYNTGPRAPTPRMPPGRVMRPR